MLKFSERRTLHYTHSTSLHTKNSRGAKFEVYRSLKQAGCDAQLGDGYREKYMMEMSGGGNFRRGKIPGNCPRGNFPGGVVGYKNARGNVRGGFFGGMSEEDCSGGSSG